MMPVKEFLSRSNQERLHEVFTETGRNKKEKIMALNEVLNEYVEKQHIINIEEGNFPNILIDYVDKVGCELEASEREKLWLLISRSPEKMNKKIPSYEPFSSLSIILLKLTVLGGALVYLFYLWFAYTTSKEVFLTGLVGGVLLALMGYGMFWVMNKIED